MATKLALGDNYLEVVELLDEDTGLPLEGAAVVFTVTDTHGVVIPDVPGAPWSATAHTTDVGTPSLGASARVTLTEEAVLALATKRAYQVRARVDAGTGLRRTFVEPVTREF